MVGENEVLAEAQLVEFTAFATPLYENFLDNLEARNRNQPQLQRLCEWVCPYVLCVVLVVFLLVTMCVLNWQNLFIDFIDTFGRIFSERFLECFVRLPFPFASSSSHLELKKD